MRACKSGLSDFFNGVNEGMLAVDMYRCLMTAQLCTQEPKKVYTKEGSGEKNA